MIRVYISNLSASRHKKGNLDSESVINAVSRKIRILPCTLGGGEWRGGGEKKRERKEGRKKIIRPYTSLELKENTKLNVLNFEN